MTGWRSHAVTAAAGVIVGSVQAVLVDGYLRASRPAYTGADRGFGDMNILGRGAWLIALVLVSVGLVGAALAVLRVRGAPVVTVAVLVAEVFAAGFLATLLPGHSDWRALVTVLPLVVLLVVAQRLSARLVPQP